MPLSERPTPDLVLLMFTGLIALVVILTGGGLFVLALIHPEYDMSAAYSSLGNALGLFVGAVLGYLAGKGRSPNSREQ